MRKLLLMIGAVLIACGTPAPAPAGREPVYVLFRLPPPPAYEKAARVIELANSGDVKAQAYLGFMYEIGHGVPQSFLAAAHWYLLAANVGDGNAQFAMGLLYNKGRGVPMNYILAYKWFNLSVSQSEGEMREFKERIRNAVSFKMSSQQIETAQNLALAWYRGAPAP